MYRDEICKCHSTSVFLFLSVYNSFILFFELKEFREDQMGKIVSLRNSLELIYLTEEKMYGSISNKAVF